MVRGGRWEGGKSLQSCPTLCDPMDGSPAGSPVPGILQARTLECAPRRAVCGTRGSLRTMPGGGSAHSCCAFTHRVAFEEGSGPRVLLKGGPGNRGRSACRTTHVAHLEFLRETGLMLRCAGKAGNPFQTMRGNRLSCRDQEGRRGAGGEGDNKARRHHRLNGHKFEERRFPRMVWKGFPAFPAHLSMRPVSRRNSR